MENITYEITNIVPEFKELNGFSDYVSSVVFTIHAKNSSGASYSATRRIMFDGIAPESSPPFVSYKYWQDNGLKEAILAHCHNKGIVDLVNKNLK